MKPLPLLLLAIPGCVPVHILPTRAANNDLVYDPPPMFLDQPAVVLNPTSERQRVMEEIAKELARIK